MEDSQFDASTLANPISFSTQAIHISSPSRHGSNIHKSTTVSRGLNTLRESIGSPGSPLCEDLLLETVGDDLLSPESHTPLLAVGIDSHSSSATDHFQSQVSSSLGSLASSLSQSSFSSPFSALVNPTRKPKHLQPVSKSIGLAKGEMQGIEWGYNSCFIDSIIFALFSYQDTFDSWLLKDIEQDEPSYEKQSKSSNNIYLQPNLSSSLDSINFNQPINHNPSSMNYNYFRDYMTPQTDSSPALSSTSVSPISTSISPPSPREPFNSQSSIHISKAKPGAEIHSSIRKQDLMLNVASASAQHAVLDYQNESSQTARDPESSMRQNPPKESQKLQNVSSVDLNRAQSGLRKIVNQLRSRGFVGNHLVSEWRSLLFRKCGVEMAFRHTSDNTYKVFLHRKGSDTAKLIQHVVSGSELICDLDLSSDIIVYPDYRIDYRTSYIQSLLPTKVYSELFPKHRKYDVILVQEIQAEYGDASEMLHAIMELFRIPPSINSTSMIETDRGRIVHNESHHILFLGVPEHEPEISLQGLLEKQFGHSLEVFRDSRGFSRQKTTKISSIDGDGIIIALKRTPTVGGKHKEVPVFVESQLSIAEYQFELTSVVCQYSNHYHTFARHPTLKNQWYYFNDKVQTEGNDASHPVVEMLSRGFGFGGFSKLSSRESKLQNLITTNGYIFTFKRLNGP